MYHSIAGRNADGALRACLDLLGMQVSVRTFERQMAILERDCDVISLSDHLAWRGRPSAQARQGVVITFDDGFADNLANAVPVLERHGFHATFFLIGCCVAQTQVPWIYSLYALLDSLDHATLSVSTPGAHVDRLVIASNGAKMAAIRALRPVVMNGTGAERLLLFDQLTDTALRHGRSAVPAERLFMNATDARELVARGFGLGAHSMTHARLTTLSPDAQRQDIFDSAAVVRKLQGDRMLPFAYPFGTAGSYSPNTTAVLKDAGFACALTTRSGLNGPRTDRFELRRLEIGEIGEAEFLATVSGLLSFPKAVARAILEGRWRRAATSETP
jgi:peptidoglycan/xylan/chitin deacetylase (PgdA/CDA1 family)